MQIACKYRSLSRYRSKQSLSLYIPLSRYVFFSRSHCTCPFLPDTLSFSLFLPALGLSFSHTYIHRHTFNYIAPKRRNQSRNKVSADEVVTEFFLIPRSFVFNPSSRSSSSIAEPFADIQFFDSPRSRRIYETPYVAGAQYVC